MKAIRLHARGGPESLRFEDAQGFVGFIVCAVISLGRALSFGGEARGFEVALQVAQATLRLDFHGQS